MNIGAGATVESSGNTTSRVFDAASINSGTIRLSGSLIGGAGDLLNLGALYGEVRDRYLATVANTGTIVNDGLISTMRGAGTPYMGLFGTVLNDVRGLVTTPGGNHSLLLPAETTNAGLIAAVNGGTVTLDGAGSNFRLDDGKG